MNKYDFSYHYQKIIGLSHMISVSIYEHDYIPNLKTLYKIENTLQ